MDKLISLACDIFSIALPVLAVLAAEWLRRKLSVERLQRIQKELETKQELAILAVRCIEQVCQDLKGTEKYNQAANWLASRAQECGLQISDDEIEGLIEATLRAFKDEFGEGWARDGLGT